VTWDPLWLSFQVAGIATLFTLVVGVSLAWLLSQPRVPGRDLLDSLVTIPLVLPPTVLGYYLLTALGKKSALGAAVFDLTGIKLTFSVTGCVIAAFVGSLPLVYKAARTAIEDVDPLLVQAARTLGAGRWRRLFTVVLPLASPGIIAGVMLGFARALGDFGATLMIAGNIPGDTQTASLYIYDQIWAGHQDRAYAMIAVLTLIAVASMWSANRLTRRRRAR
jgi:molybdate transport system permease protein